VLALRDCHRQEVKLKAQFEPAATDSASSAQITLFARYGVRSQTRYGLFLCRKNVCCYKLVHRNGRADQQTDT